MKFSTTSLQRLSTCDPKLQLVMKGALATNLIDISIIEGARGRETQDLYFKEGKSKVPWPNSKHNGEVSLAVDAGPYVNGQLSFNKDHCCFLAGIVLGVSKSLGIPLRWGGNWDMDGEPLTDQDFQDLVHYEII